MRLYFSPYNRDVINMLPSDSGLICSTSQVNAKGGYTGFTLDSLRKATDRELWVDHLGKGGEDVEEVIKQVVDAGWNGVHLHTTDLDLIGRMTHDYDISFELGTGEDPVDGDYVEFMESVLRCARTDRIRWLSFPTGCKIQGTHNVNQVDKVLGARMRALGFPLKGHNSDYINADSLSDIDVDALNVAPQLGVLLTRVYVQYARTYGIDVSHWEQIVVREGKWRKWTNDESLAVDLGGQYHLQSLPVVVTRNAYELAHKQVRALCRHLNRFINKRWGWEEVIEENDRYQVKRLFMRKGMYCSLHYHAHKRETVTVLSGVLNINGSTLLPGGSVTLAPMFVHRMTAVEDCFYLESAYSGLDEDNVRL